MSKLNLFDKNFIKLFLGLSLPMALQNLITSSVNLIDTLMIGQLGETAIAAVGLANKVYFVFSIMIFGMCGGSSAFLTQFLGKKDTAGIKKVLFLNLALAGGFSVIAFLTACFFPTVLMGWLSDDTAVIQEGAKYLRLVAVSYIPTAISYVMGYALKSVEQPKIPLVTSLISIVTNAFFNYTFIFGKFGAPELGAVGAAIGTIIARYIEFAVIIILSLKKLEYLRHNIGEYFHKRPGFIKNYYKLVVPVTLNETLWSLGTTLLSAIFARVSTECIASVNIINILYETSSVLIFGMSHAAGIIIGKEIGAGRKENAYLFAKRFNIYVPVLAIACILILNPLMPMFLNLFKIDAKTLEITKNLTKIMFFFFPLRSFAHLNIVGTLRSGGDAIFCVFADVASLWIIAVPFTFIFGILLEQSVEVTYFVSQVEQFIKITAILVRMRKNTWIKDLVN
ncbi:MAG: MATE family efflux transporter [Clostridia bacterium]|nr:MATE family efflux transporter [Clostridia bacterium]